MANRKKRKIRRVRKNHMWLSMILFLIGMLGVGAVAIFSAGMFFYYIAESKLVAEYDAISQMADMYSQVSGEGAGEVLDGAGREYLLKDAAGETLFEKGGENCSDREHLLLMHIFAKEIRVYQDLENPCLYIDDYDRLRLNRRVFARRLEEDLVAFRPGNDSGKKMEELKIQLPIWMAVETGDGAQLLIGRAFFQLDFREMALFAMFAALIAALFVLIFGIMLVGLISSILNQKRTIRLFFTDIVTDGHNFMWFIYHAEQLLKKRRNAKKRYAVVNLVFVNYRNYCVCHSIQEGERMLKKVYWYLHRTLNRKEMCAHVTSADFALLLQYEDEEQLKNRLETLVDQLKQLQAEHVFAFQVGVDLVDVVTDEKGKVVRRKNIDVEVEYNNACTARSVLAENDDSGIEFFDNRLVEEQKWIDQVTDRQKTALENEEFVVYYQPKYDPSTDQLRGAEALIRWQSPELGFVPPGKFIPIYEKNGFITEIDHYMLDHVAADQKKWLDQGHDCVPVSVNVSRAHFIESDLAEQIRDIVDSHGTPHDLVEIELTESAFFDDKKALVTTINRLKGYGFTVSMDDFGSGYSSLNSLKDMPLDVLKLDAEFFRGESGDGRGQIVVSEAIRLAKSLNMRTVAEGVEVKEQVEFLAGEGCDMIQGYYYAKPMPGEEYEKRM